MTSIKLPRTPSISPPAKSQEIAPQELEFENYNDYGELIDDTEEIKEDKKEVDINKTTPSEQLDKLIDKLYELNSESYDEENFELEVRFGTKNNKIFTHSDYDNVIKSLKSFGFKCKDSNGLSTLRIKTQFLDANTGRFKMSNIRTEINGLNAIQYYCNNNDIKKLIIEQPNTINFLKKSPFTNIINGKSVRLKPIDFLDFNFRVSLQIEEKASYGLENYIKNNWTKSKKEFRYLNRVSFIHDDYPFIIDLSIVKSGSKAKDKNGYNYIIPVYNLQESNLFNNNETYEIEIEIDNSRIGPGTNFQSSKTIGILLRKVIKYILIGLQGTNYPISYNEQNNVLNSMMLMIHGKDYIIKRLTSHNFIGPNSITLQMNNIISDYDNSNIPNIRKDFVVTDKADGSRHLLYIAKDGKIYLISSSMEVKFSGAYSNNKEYYNSLIDGELITHDKNGDFINLYASFDIYYINNNDVRHLPFVLLDELDKKKLMNSRLYILDNLIKNLNPLSILSIPINKLKKDREEKKQDDKFIISPLRVTTKKFYPNSLNQSIFEACRIILNKEKEKLFEYETDGLIFTHMYYGVGSNEINKSGPKFKITWENSFKWKPPQYNTIDFLVTTLKERNGNDVIKSIYEEGLNNNSDIQYNEYKIIELRCGFNEKYDGFINPCQDIYDDKLPEYKPRFEDRQVNEYLPKRFYPSEPYDPNAGLANISLKIDDSGNKQMYTLNNEVFGDNTIVEFAYDLDKIDGWRWIPLRVRYDKTSKLRNGEKEFGNSYKVCNENWKSIHPSGRITEEMITSGEFIPNININEDIYYNTPSGELKTQALKNFHNLYVKKKLIMNISKPGDNLIDFACGKAGDLPKWISAKLSLVVGIDYSRDNIENRVDGACVRYLKSRMENKKMPYALFLHGNSAFSLNDGSALLNDKAKQIMMALIGEGPKPKNDDKLGRGVLRHYGVASNGFNISSIQFALHYFFESPDILKGFLKNVAQNTKLNGYFIGTCYDGKTLFNELKKIKTNESIQIVENNKKLWEIVKNYGSDVFDDNSSSIGYKINVYQESINNYINEYLVNFNYFVRLMESYGFIIINNDEAKQYGLPNGSGMFSELFNAMLEEIKLNKYKANEFKEAPNMTSYEKKISFLNRYFIFKKIREVSLDKIIIDLNDYEENKLAEENIETKEAIIYAKRVIANQESEKKLKKIKKLSKKLLLEPASEIIEETIPPITITSETQPIIIKPKTKKRTKQIQSKITKKKLILQEDNSDKEK